LTTASVRVERWRGAAAIVLRAGELEATFVPQLNLLGTSLRLGGEEFLALPGGIGGYRRGHTTGLPLLAPWANRLSSLTYRSGRTRVELSGLALHTDGNGLPIHGTLSARDAWTIQELAAHGGIARLDAAFRYDSPELLAAFPFSHRLDVTVVVDGGSLFVTTVLRPTGARAVPVSFGFHPYFRLPRGPRASWRLQLPRRDRLELDARGIPTGRRTTLPAEAEPIGELALDDLFELRTGRTLGLEHGGHRLSVDFGSGYRFAQVFAPPGKRFVALEPMTAATNALVEGTSRLVRPGERYTARFRVRPERLS
jgi:aldose 1-epimerase